MSDARLTRWERENSNHTLYSEKSEDTAEMVCRLNVGRAIAMYVDSVDTRLV